MMEYQLDVEEQENLLFVYEKISLLALDSDARIAMAIAEEKLKAPFFTKSKLKVFLHQKFKNDFKHALAIILNIPVVQKPNILTMLLGFLFGQVIKEYEGGVWLKTIKADPSQDEIVGSPSSKDRKEFALHTDLSYIENPPSYFLFHCIGNALEFGGASIYSEASNLLPRLSTAAKKELVKVQFQFPAPHYYVESSCITRSILTSIDDSAFIRFRQDGMRFLTRSAIEAVNELISLLQEEVQTLPIKKGEAIFLNNRRCLHGRYAFLLSDNKNIFRHFNQVYVDVRE